MFNKCSTNDLIKQVHAKGFNISMMLNLFKKRRRLAEPLPDEVIQEVCREYLIRGEIVNDSFPYFLEVLKQQTMRYFAKKNEAEGKKFKNEPVKLKITIG